MTERADDTVHAVEIRKVSKVFNAGRPNAVDALVDVDLTISPSMSLQLYLEPFMSAGDYQGVKEFARRRAFDFYEYGVDIGTLAQDAGGYTADPDGPGPVPAFSVPNRDFSYRSLIGNAVLRWEWREGSTIFLVWQQRRIDSMTNRGVSTPSLPQVIFSFGTAPEYEP